MNGKAGTSHSHAPLMPKRKIPFLTSLYYHLYNRGVAKQPIFLEEKDYKIFVRLMSRFVESQGSTKKRLHVSLVCFCLMPNHFHILLKQENDHGIVDFLQRFLTAYSMYFNYKYSRVGPLFQGRTNGKVIHDDVYLLELSRYIHRNPIKLFPKKEDILQYPYSSLKYYLLDPSAASSPLLSPFGGNQEFYGRFVLFDR